MWNPVDIDKLFKKKPKKVFTLEDINDMIDFSRMKTAREIINNSDTPIEAIKTMLTQMCEKDILDIQKFCIELHAMRNKMYFEVRDALMREIRGDDPPQGFPTWEAYWINVDKRQAN